MNRRQRVIARRLIKTIGDGDGWHGIGGEECRVLSLILAEWDYQDRVYTMEERALDQRLDRKSRAGYEESCPYWASVGPGRGAPQP